MNEHIFLLIIVYLRSALSLNPIVRKGHYLYDNVKKERFYIKGVTYSPELYSFDKKTYLKPRSTDYASDDMEAQWMRDVPYLQELGVNTVRLYNIDPRKSHEKFMNKMNENGIYVLVPLTTMEGSGVLDAGIPSPGCYTSSLLISAKKIVNQFAKYDNTLAFVAANEVGNKILRKDGNKTNAFDAIPCVKALVRDIKAYMRSCACSMRVIPLTYAATDHSPVGYSLKPRQLISNYLTCGNDSDSTLDMYGVNLYTWCAADATFDFHSTYGLMISEESKKASALLPHLPNAAPNDIRGPRDKGKRS